MDGAAASERSRFGTAFARSARPIRARIALGRALTGAAVGLAIGAACAGALWKTRHGAARPWTAVAGLVGIGAGLAVAKRRRWSDDDVALFLDARLESNEAIATGVEVARGGGVEGDAASVILTDALSALSDARKRRVRVSFLRPWHLALPATAAAIAYLSWLPLPRLATPPPPAGSEMVQLADIAGLEKVIALERVHARDDAQRERLAKLAERAKQLRDQLHQGMEKRDAQAEIAKLRDDIAAERFSLGDGERRQGLESAIGKLSDDPNLRGAAKALGDRDLVELDEEMEKLAATLEHGDRERAKKTLEEAAEAAKKNGASDVAKMLEEQKRLFDQRGQAGDALRELAKDLGDTLGEDGKKALKDWQKSGRPEDAKKLADALGKGLEKLTPEQRKKLAENLKKRAEQMGDAPERAPSKEQMKELAKELDSPEGQKRLEDALKELADAEQGSEDADRQRALDGAQEGANEADGQLGGVPMPLAAQGPKAPHPSGPAKPGPDDKGPATPGHTEGGGPGTHDGHTDAVDGSGVKARVSGPLGKGAPMPGVALGRTSGRPGDTARLRGTDALGTVGPGEIHGVERSDVPEEYREQVGRYFEPK